MNVISRNISDESPDAVANRLINNAEYQDGLQEIAIGILILVFVGLMFFPLVFKMFVYKAFFWGGLVLIPIAYGSQRAVKAVRKRYLIGKVGYVKFKPANQKRLGVRLATVFGISFLVAILATFVTVKAMIATHTGGEAGHWGFFPPFSWLILGSGILLGAIVVFRVRLLRYVIGAVIAVALSIVLAFSSVSLNVGLAILYGFAGLFPLISGCVVFYLLIRKHDEAGA